MEVILLRHGQTHGNAQRRYIGRTDEPLSAVGREMLTKRPPFPTVSRVFVTPLVRTQQTASLLFPHATQTVAEGLSEMDFGDFEGKTADELSENSAYRHWVEGGCFDACPNGEGRQAFSRRCSATFERIVQELSRNGESLGVFVLHGGSIMAILEQFALPHKDFYAYHIGNGDGFRCAVSSLSPLILENVREIGDKTAKK